MLNKLRSTLRKTVPVRFFIRLSQKLVIPGFDGISLYEIGGHFIHGLQNGMLSTRASAIAFNFFLAMFPAIIFLFTLIPYVPVEDFQEELIIVILEFLPKNAQELGRSTIEDIITNQRGGLLSVGFITAFYFASNGIGSMMRAFRESYHVTEYHGTLQGRLISSLLVALIAILITAAIILIIFNQNISNYLIEQDILNSKIVAMLFQVGQWLIVIALFYSVTSSIYYLGVKNKTKWHMISAGSSFTTILSIITSLGFAYYVNNFGQYNKLYGSIGTLIVIMLWIYFNCYILLIGFEINVSLESAQKARLEQ